MKRVLVVGATSAIAHATAMRFAAAGASLCLAARDPRRLAGAAAELRANGAEEVHELPFEASRLDEVEPLFRRAAAALGEIDAVLVAHGELSDQRRCEADADALLHALTVNGLSVLVLLTHVANDFEARRRGCIAVISSGAGARGRRTTYAYGTAKAMVTVFLQGLRARLHPAGVSVLTVLPCFVDTPMTAYLPKRMRWIPPRHAGARIHAAMLAGKDVVHVPRAWRLALALFRNLPEGLVKRSRAEQRMFERIVAEAEARDSSGSGVR